MARFNKTPYLFYPEHKGKVLWDLFMTVILLTSCVLTPLDIAFDEGSDGHAHWLATLIDIIFAIDMLVTFNTVTFDKNNDMVEKRKQIASMYLKGWFTVDLIAIIPFD